MRVRACVRACVCVCVCVCVRARARVSFVVVFVCFLSSMYMSTRHETVEFLINFVL